MEGTATQVRPTPRRAWIGGALALAIAAVAIVTIWGIALPITPPGTVCTAIYPPAPGCAGEARILPAAVWTLLIGLTAVATWFLSRRAWWGVLIGALGTAAVGFAGYVATLYMRVFLVA